MKNVMACVDAQGNPAAVCDGAIWAAKALGASLTLIVAGVLVLNLFSKSSGH